MTIGSGDDPVFAMVADEPVRDVVGVADDENAVVVVPLAGLSDVVVAATVVEDAELIVVVVATEVDVE